MIGAPSFCGLSRNFPIYIQYGVVDTIPRKYTSIVPTEYDSALIEKLFPIAQVSVGNPRSFLMAQLTECRISALFTSGWLTESLLGRGVLLGMAALAIGDCRRESFQPQLDAMNRRRALLRNSRVGVQNGTDSSFLPLHNEHGDAP